MAQAALMKTHSADSRVSRRALLGALAVVPIALAHAPADSAETDFSTWVTLLRTEAAGRGISKATLDSALANIEPIPRVLELDRSQPEFTLTYAQYLARVVSDARAQRGRELMETHGSLLSEISQKYGVQARFVVALWGIETDFGRITGGFNVIPALATLAYDGRRANFFRGELMHALTIIERGHIAARDMKGSWAGAMGQPQFMPSTFNGYAVDYNRDGRADIWTTPADIFASAANYLAKSGWRSDQTWGRAVTVPQGFDRGLYGQGVSKPLAEWAALGIARKDGQILPNRPVNASLIEAEANGPTFLIYDNFRVIMRWNRSIFFALAAGQLADRIGGE